jgi:hypothetical protein
VLALAAAGTVLEMGGTVHRLNVFDFFILGNILFSPLILVRLRLAA